MALWFGLWLCGLATGSGLVSGYVVQSLALWFSHWLRDLVIGTLLSLWLRGLVSGPVV